MDFFGGSAEIPFGIQRERPTENAGPRHNHVETAITTFTSWVARPPTNAWTGSPHCPLRLGRRECRRVLTSTTAHYWALGFEVRNPKYIQHVRGARGRIKRTRTADGGGFTCACNADAKCDLARGGGAAVLATLTRVLTIAVALTRQCQR